jgi:hypothetical protein
MIVRFLDNGGIVDYNCLIFLFISNIEFTKNINLYQFYKLFSYGQHEWAFVVTFDIFFDMSYVKLNWNEFPLTLKKNLSLFSTCRNKKDIQIRWTVLLNFTLLFHFFKQYFYRSNCSLDRLFYIDEGCICSISWSQCAGYFGTSFIFQ